MFNLTINEAGFLANAFKALRWDGVVDADIFVRDNTRSALFMDEFKIWNVNRDEMQAKVAALTDEDAERLLGRINQFWAMYPHTDIVTGLLDAQLIELKGDEMWMAPVVSDERMPTFSEREPLPLTSGGFSNV